MNPQESVLYLNNVSVSFDGFKAINELSLYVEKNELRCIIGPNGAGKTTMMDIITGKTKPDEGEVYFGDHIDLTNKDEAEIANLGIGRKFQKPTVFENHNVFDNLCLALEGNRNIFGNLFYKLTEDKRNKIDQSLETIGLQAECYRTAGELSHGQKQWLEIGMLITQNPQVLLVDEPVAGMTHQESNCFIPRSVRPVCGLRIHATRDCCVVCRWIWIFDGVWKLYWRHGRLGRSSGLCGTVCRHLRRILYDQAYVYSRKQQQQQQQQRIVFSLAWLIVTCRL